MIIVWLALPLTLVVFFLARYLSQKVKSPICNPLLISMIVIIAILVVLHIPYAPYLKGSSILNYLLQPAVVTLAYPLYELLPKIKKQWKSLFAICIFSSLCAMFVGALIAALLGADPVIAASVLPKSVTTPIAMAVSSTLGGNPSISAICVIFVGIVGAILGHIVLNIFKIKSKSARGLSIGSVSHVLGTSRSVEVDPQEGAYSSLALVLCGIFTSILAPLVFMVIKFIFY